MCFLKLNNKEQRRIRAIVDGEKKCQFLPKDSEIFKKIFEIPELEKCKI